MDILTHTLSGVAVASCAVSFSNYSLSKKGKVLLLGGIAGSFPDIDAISLWSKFDQTIGSIFGLTHTGKEIYFEKFWYSHHAFFHSLFAALLFTCFVSLLLYLRKREFLTNEYVAKSYFYEQRWIFVAVFFGYCAHLLEDMPTPHCVWGGVNLFFPSDVYIGGTGQIWWWNNYDIFLLVVLCIFLNVSMNIVKRFYAFRLKLISGLITLACITAILIQINTRPADFNYKGFTSDFAKYEARSLEIQEEILGDWLFGVMQKFDNSFRLKF